MKQEVKLSSALDRSQQNLSKIEVKVWFQRELPYPDIDLGDIKARSPDVFPKELAGRIVAEADDGFTPLNARIKQGFFYQQYARIIDKNFVAYSQGYERKRELEVIVAQDIAANYHLLP